MERMTERRREPEPVMYDQLLEETWFKWEEEKKRLRTLPHVFKYNEIPWTQGGQAFHKHYTGNGLGLILNKAPLYTLAIAEQILAPGGHSGRHRHSREACFYILEGKG